MGLGITDGFSLYIFHSSNVFKIFHTNIPLGDCVKGGRAEGTQFHSEFSYHKGGKQALSLEQNQLLWWVHSQEKDFFSTSLDKCHLCVMVYRAVPSCLEVVQCWNLVISLMLRA